MYLPREEISIGLLVENLFIGKHSTEGNQTVAATHALSLEVLDIDNLEALTRPHPGITDHMALIALVRIGIQQASQRPELLAHELSAIQLARRERRKSQLSRPEGSESNG